MSDDEGAYVVNDPVAQPVQNPLNAFRADVQREIADIPDRIQKMRKIAELIKQQAGNGNNNDYSKYYDSLQDIIPDFSFGDIATIIDYVSQLTDEQNFRDIIAKCAESEKKDKNDRMTAMLKINKKEITLADIKNPTLKEIEFALGKDGENIRYVNVNLVKEPMRIIAVTTSYQAIRLLGCENQTPTIVKIAMRGYERELKENPASVVDITKFIKPELLTLYYDEKSGFEVKLQQKNLDAASPNTPPTPNTPHPALVVIAPDVQPATNTPQPISEPTEEPETPPSAQHIEFED